jgi:RND family efflux transporter MFP subunit
MPSQPKLGRVAPGLLAVALGGLAPGACTGGKGAAAQRPRGVPVKVEAARQQSVDVTSEYVATLRSRQSTAVMPQVDGQVTRIFVHAGDQVTPGTPLLQIDPEKQQATLSSVTDTVAAKRAALEYARQQFQRVSGLSKEGVVSSQDLDQARTALDSAQANLSATEAQVREQTVQLQYYTVTAPRAGVVGDIPVRVGDRVTASTQLTTVDTPGALEAYVSVPVERAAELRVGMPVRIVDESGKVLTESHVRFISPQVSDATQTVLVKAPIENPKRSLRPAQFVRVQVVWATQQGTLVPVLAVDRIGNQAFVFLAHEKDGMTVAQQKLVELGEIVGNDYVVLAGVRPGESVIVSGTQFLRDGIPVFPQG